MKYFDKKGIEIKAGVSIMIKNDNIERVHDIVDAYGNADPAGGPVFHSHGLL